MNIIYPNNLTKYSGGIVENDNFYQYLNKTDDNIYYKNFYYNKYSKKKDALDEAHKHMKKYCINNNQVLNKYIEKDNICFVVYLNTDDDYMIVDKDHIELVNKYNWRLQNKITYAINESGIPFHELAFSSKYIIHKDGNKLDNRSNNIENVTEEQFIWHTTHKNRLMRLDNQSGFTGVCKVTVGKYEYWEVRGKNYQGRKILKRFSVKKLGDLGAKSQAIVFRKENIDDTY